MTDAVKERRGREGGRWINERPEPTEFAEWFTASMKLDPALDHADYIGGVVLIPAVDTKAPHVTGFRNGVPIIEKREELSYIPYAKVETRTAYWWDLLDQHPEWVGEVERVTPARLPLDFITEEERRPEGEGFVEVRRRQPGALTVLVHQLPDGFSIMSVPVKEGYTHFLCCTTRVAIYKRGEDGEPTGRPLRSGQGTKQVPLLTGYRDNPYADPSALMKAETGSLGRALGFAGIFVIPGSGVATAEDMLEALAQGPPPAEAPPAAGNTGPDSPTAAPVRTGAEQAEDDEATLRARAIALFKALSDEDNGKAEEFGAWAKQRSLTSFGDARGAMLRGAVKKLEKLTDQAGATGGESAPAAQPEPTEEAGHVPGETPAAAEPSGPAS